jgi:hypothetical protein
MDKDCELLPPDNAATPAALDADTLAPGPDFAEPRDAAAEALWDGLL